MQVAEFFGCQSSITPNFSQQFSGFEPMPFRRREDRMILLQHPEEGTLRRPRGASPQFRLDDRGCANQSTEGLDPLSVSIGTQVVSEDRGVENDEIRHSAPRTSSSRHGGQ